MNMYCRLEDPPSTTPIAIRHPKSRFLQNAGKSASLPKFCKVFSAGVAGTILTNLEYVSNIRQSSKSDLNSHADATIGGGHINKNRDSPTLHAAAALSMQHFFDKKDDC